MKKLILFFSIVLILNINKATATNLRGKLVRTNGSLSNPLAQTKVELLFWNGRGWDSRGYAITGNDGFYFFVNITPGAKFCLLILGRYYPIIPLIVQDVASPNYQDLPLIKT